MDGLVVHMSKHVVRTKAYINDDEYYYKIVRTNIKRIRIEHGLTQQDLADMTELSREYICDIENEKRNKHPSVAVIGRVADALEIDIMMLFKE